MDLENMNANIHNCDCEEHECSCCHDHEETSELYQKETEYNAILEDTSEEVLLSANESAYINAILEENAYIDDMNDDESSKTLHLHDGWRDEISVDSLIKILFAMHKPDEAWDLIETKYDEIDYHDVIESPYARLKVASPAFQKLYDSGQLNDLEFGYYLVINNDCNNEFWADQLKDCNSAESVLDKIGSFYAFPNIPHIEPRNSIIEERFIDLCSDKDKLDDYIFNNKSHVRLTIPMIKTVIDNHAVTKESITRLYGVYHLMLIKADDDEITEDEKNKQLNEFWAVLDDHSPENEAYYHVRNMDMFDIEQIEDILSRSTNIDHDIIRSMVFNTPYILEYMMVIKEMFKKYSVEFPTRISDILNANMLPYLSYFARFRDLFEDIDENYIISESIGQLPIVYDKHNNLLSFDNNIYKYEPKVRDVLFGFIEEVIDKGTIINNNEITVKIFTDEYNNSYRCECGNVIGVDKINHVCDICHSKVTDHGVDERILLEKSLRYKNALDRIDSLNKANE